ncbi:MAG: hypothetical protein ACK5LL_17230 [Suipraeoptans sp.]
MKLKKKKTRNKIKRIIVVVIFMLIIFIESTYFLNSSGQQETPNLKVYNYLTTVEIFNDGSAEVNETWYCDVNTENVLQLSKKLEYENVYDFSVKNTDGTSIKAEVESNHTYSNLTWEVANTGAQEFTLSYKINNIISKYEDMYGLNMSYLSSQLTDDETFPEEFKVTITGDCIDCNITFASYGYNDSDYISEYSGEYSVVYSYSNVENKDNDIRFATFLVGFPQYQFLNSDDVNSDLTFVQVKETLEEMEGLENENNILVWASIVGIIVVLVAISIILHLKKGRI